MDNIPNAAKKRRRKSTRLKDYDYSKSGAYFVTICTKERVNYFGNADKGKIALSRAGNTAYSLWLTIPDRFNTVKIDRFVVMPNHIHGIIIIRRGLINQTPTAENPECGWILMQNPTQNLGKVVRYFKAKATRIIRRNGLENFDWQRNYHDRIIRNECELNSKREYIINNPLKWDLDRENPDSVNFGIDHELYFKEMLG